MKNHAENEEERQVPGLFVYRKVLYKVKASVLRFDTLRFGIFFRARLKYTILHTLHCLRPLVKKRISLMAIFFLKH